MNGPFSAEFPVTVIGNEAVLPLVPLHGEGERGESFVAVIGVAGAEGRENVREGGRRRRRRLENHHHHHLV